MLTWLVPHRRRPDFLPEEATRRLCAAVMESPYLASTDLNQGFTGTLGFSMVFRRSGLEQVRRRLPEAEPYLDGILKPRANAFFLNPLVIYRGVGVGAHADKTLRSFTRPYEPPFPLCVSVLYLNVPDGLVGGQLVLHRLGRAWARLKPEFNTLVEFAGYLSHEVTSMDAGDQARVSLVCEQYALPDRLLELIPEFAMDTTRPFQDFLDAEIGPENDEEPVTSDIDD